MFDGGLLGSFYGRMILCGILAFLGLCASGFLTLVTHARKGLPLTTQTNRVTGVREAGIFRWFATFAAFLACPWLLAMFILTTTHLGAIGLAWVAVNWWVVPVAITGLLLAGIGWFMLRRAPRDRVEPVQQSALPGVAVTTAEPTVVWSLPEISGNWNER